MLTITRREGEIIEIGDEITIKVVRCEGNKVRIGVDAPRELSVGRAEHPDSPRNQRVGDAER